jgi:hypothetical protein
MRTFPMPSRTRDNKTAFLWDESFLWGLMSYRALKSACLPFDLVRSEDILKGVLSRYKLLFVPGGWASNKIKTLGPEGIIKIKEFVGSGGNYLGFCGGGGLATLDGIGLLNLSRKPTKERVPSFSGRIRLNLSEHPIWQGITEPVFHAWWPSQLLRDGNDTSILASYSHALPDSFSSDLSVGDTVRYGNWSDMEKHYRINLNPDRLVNDPAVVEGTYGEGMALLSLIHFDTPGDTNGSVVLKNLWRYLGGIEDAETRRHGDTEIKAHEDTGTRRYSVNVVSPRPRVSASPRQDFPRPGCGVSEVIADLESAVDELISLGERNFLWFWRNPMLLQWRRGVRGLEYCTLYVLIKEISERIKYSSADPSLIADHVFRIKDSLIPFVEKAMHLLILERHAMQNGPITYETCDNPEIQKIRTELFAGSKSYGGKFKELIDKVDTLLYALL